VDLRTGPARSGLSGEHRALEIKKALRSDRAMIDLLAVKQELEAAPKGQRQAVLARLYGALNDAPKPELDAAVATFLPLLEVSSPNDCADLALVLGALVECGAEAEPLARAFVAPLERWVVAAARFVELAEELDDAPQSMNRDETVDLDDRVVAKQDLDDLCEDDPEAVASWFALEVLYRPAVASMTRVPSVLVEARRRQGLREALDTLRDLPGGSWWLRVLFDTCQGERLVFLLPERKEAFELVADGVVDVGQLTVLLSSVFAPQLAAIGASRPARDDVLGVMLGVGPQQLDEVYSSHFYLYPWRSLNPQLGVPEDDRHTWYALTGSGTHSLPADFQPATSEPLDGARVFFLVGPNLPSLRHRFVRELGASRMFERLQARLSEPLALGEPGFSKWMTRITAELRAPSG
jgi:hypothetical protein